MPTPVANATVPGAFPPSARRAILQWIDAAMKPETRAKRIAETARLANQNVRANQPNPRG